MPETGTTFDREALWNQISLNVKMSLGILPADVVYDATSLYFVVGSRRSHRNMIVKYESGTDTYALTLGHSNRRLEWIVDAETSGIAVDALNETMLGIYGRVVNS